MEKILASRSTSKFHEVALVQGVDKVFRVFVNGKVITEAWEYKDALEVYKRQIKG